VDISTYEIESEVEQTHWWFVGRRNLFKNLIKKMNLPEDAKILDIGTSTGTNLRLLKQMGFSNYQGMDLHDEAIKWCAIKQLGVVCKGDVCDIPFPDATFDLVMATDIIEHVDDDLRAVQEIKRVLAPGGQAIITVPAFQSLWGMQDDVSQHKRRYLKKPFAQLLTQAPLRITDINYFNFLLFIPICLVRKIIKLSGIKLKSENQINSFFINKVLGLIFELDIAALKYVKPPFGVSILAVVKNPV